MGGMITFLIAALLGMFLVTYCSEALLAGVALPLLALQQLDWPVIWQWSQPVLWVVAYGFGALVLFALLDECLAIWRENSLTKKSWRTEDTKDEEARVRMAAGRALTCTGPHGSSF